MKTLLALLALSVGPASHAADYTGCRTQLLGVADAYAAYMSSQSADCVAEMNKQGATRSRLSIIAKCSNALGQLQPIKSKSETACNACSSMKNIMNDAIMVLRMMRVRVAARYTPS